MRSSISPSLLSLALAASLAAGAQSLQVYSPFTRIDPFGEIVPPDRAAAAAEPREILSPALPRNAVTGFHLIVSGQPGAIFNLYIGQNPDHAAVIHLYREIYVRAGDSWIPDGLQPVSLPYQGRISTEGIPGQTAQAFWMDLRVSRDSPVQRIKIEPQASFDDRWIHYPMEARIVVTAAPSLDFSPSVSPPSAEAPADIAARRVLKLKLCGKTEKVAPHSPLTIRDMIARDAAQDVAMASVVPVDELWGLIGAGGRAAWCQAEAPHSEGPEWYLRLRDRIIGAKR